MHIIYLPSTADDVRWFRHYYTRVFQAGSQAARAHLYAAESSLAANPYLGRQLPHKPGLRSLVIARTPFTITYRIQGDEIQILRLFDTRRDI